LCVERDFGQNSARPSSFSRSVQGRLRRIGSRRSAKIRLEIFRSLGLSVQPIASDGLDSLRLLATFTFHGPERVATPDILAALQKAHSKLRGVVALAIHRKKTPELTFHVLRA